MSMIFGLLSLSGEAAPSEWIAAMEGRAARWPCDHPASQTGGGGFVAIRERSRYAGAPPGGFAFDQANGNAVVLDGRIDNRAELQSALGLSDANDATLVLAAHRHWGADFARHLIGDFALAVLHDGGKWLDLARDAMGVRPLFHASGGGFHAFASSMDVLLALPFVDRTPDMVWLGDFLEVIKSDAESTPYAGIAALAPATRLAIGRDGAEANRFWSPPPLAEVLDIDEAEAVAEYRRLFDQAVACRLPAKGMAASELSGGLDSTSVAVTAAPMLTARGDCLLTLSHVLGSDSEQSAGMRDERAEVEAVLAVMPKGEHRWLDRSHASQIDALAATLARHGGPQRRDFNSVDHGLAEAMRDADCRVLLSGFGGDQLATSLGAGLIESLAREGRWAELAQLSASPFSRLSWRFAAGRRFQQWRAERRFAAKARATVRLTRPELIDDDSLTQRRLAFPDRPLHGTIGERERAVIVSPHIGQRGQDSTVGAGAQGFEYAYPMLDLRLVEFVLRLPDRLKARVDERRVLIRAAMAGRLPDVVRLRDDKSPAAVPVAGTRFRAERADYAALFARHRHDPLLTRLVDMEQVMAQLEHFAGARERRAGINARQFRRIAELCLWSEWIQADQPNHAE